ncbi:MAG: crotonase/enoyl-CoA hydratase family protein [Acidimicrobiales bacterium]
MSDRLTVTMDGGVADVRLNRPDKRNALDGAMFDALVETSAALAEDSAVRCVVLSGEGASFCAGLDFGSFNAMADGSMGGGDSDSDDSDGGSRITDIEEGRITHHGQQACYGWTSMPVPVIAAVHGHALGGGIQLALSADVRIVAPDTKMSVLEIRWGLIPDMTGTQSLVDLVGLDVAKELTFTGRMVSGAEAAELGLATHVSDDPRADALAMAHEIAGKSPHAIRAAKRLFNDAPRVGRAEGFAAERAEIGKLIGSPNQVESVMAFFEKRDPNFADPS